MATTRLTPRACGIVGLFLFVALSLTDLLLTRALVGDGQGAVYEANPLAAWCLKNHGWVGMTAFKFGTVLLFGGCIVRIARQRPRIARRLLAVCCSTLTAVVLYSAGLLVISAPLNAELRHETERSARMDEQLARDWARRAAR